MKVSYSDPLCIIFTNVKHHKNDLPSVKMHPVRCLCNKETSTFLPSCVEALLLQLHVQDLAQLGQSDMKKQERLYYMGVR